MGNSCSNAVFCTAPPDPSSPKSSRRSSLQQRVSLLGANVLGGARPNNNNNEVFNSTADPQGFISSVAGHDTRRNSSVMEGTEKQDAVMAGALDVSENQMSTTHFNELESVRATISRGSWGSHRIPEESLTDSIIFVALGAHSDRFFGQVLPTLMRLYETSLIDQTRSQFVAMGLEDSSDAKFQAACKERLGASSKKNEFIGKLKYIRGDCTKSDDLRKIPTNSAERTLYFFCLPDAMRHSAVMKAIAEAPNTTSWTRVVLLGSDPQTYDMSASLTIGEDRIFRVDPFAGSDAVRRIVALRFGNRVLEPTWNRNHVKAILVDFSLDASVSATVPSETFLRNALLDHVLGLVALVAMERPASRFGDDVRDAKLAVLQAIQVVSLDKCVLGRVETDSVTATTDSASFAMIILEIDTNRWRGVPFICRVGTHLDRTKSEVRVQFRAAAGADALWRDQGAGLKDNELTIRVVPSENAVLDLVSNLPGLDTQLKTHHSTLDFLSQPTPFVPEPLERLVYDAMRGRRANFARRDCLEEALRIVRPVLNADSARFMPYGVASRTGPRVSDDLIAGHLASDHNSSPRSRHATCPWTADGLATEDAWVRATDLSVERELMLTLRLGSDQMRLLMRAFTKEMERGLAARTTPVAEKVTIKMLETYVTRLPSGSEEGVYFALDIGGTNFRVVKFALSKRSAAVKVAEAHFRIPEECKHGPAEQLFDFLAESIGKVQEVDEEAVYGFTFSFPTQQESLSSGRLITWTKGWTTAGVVNAEVSSLLHAALVRRRLKGGIVALVNDTVGTLAAKSCEDPLVRVGVILGTGTNAAFLDPLTGSVINTEWGGFGSFGVIPELPFNKVDLAIDRESPNPGEQWFEKMISGFYLGEIARKWLLLLHESKEIWSSASFGADSPVMQCMSLDTKDLSDVELDLSDNLDGIKRIEEKILGVKNSSIVDRMLVRLVARCVVERAARLTACAIAGVVNRIHRPGTVVAIDGSLFEAHASFKQRLVRALDSLGCQCPLVLSKDGSGLGAALIAAAASSPV